MALLALSEALENMLSRLPEPSIIEHLPLNECANRILAEDLFLQLMYQILIIQQWMAMPFELRI